MALPDFPELDRLKALLDSHRPLDPAMVANLHEDQVLRWTYHSNAIEGNTLTLMETKVVLEGITIGGKPLREHFEAINHREAIGYVEGLVAQAGPLSEHQIKGLHQLVLKNIDDRNAGRYRTSNVIISGARHKPVDFLRVDEAMADFMDWYRGQAQALHPVERAARVHADFVGIHPFVDGNGRTSRLLMNLELMKAGFPPAVLTVERRLEYYRALDAAHVDGDYVPLLSLVTEVVQESFAVYWYALGIRV
jgi:Fic family protein